MAKKTPDPLTEADRALLSACADGHLARARRALAAGARIAHGGPQLPLVEAARRGLTKVARLLLEHGADPWAAEPTGDSALSVAARRGHLGVVEVCLRPGDTLDRVDSSGQTLLMTAVSGGALAVVLHLLKEGADPNATSKHASLRGATALHFLGAHRGEAFATGAASMIADALRGAGANPAARDAHGQTVLHVAAQNPTVTPDFFDKIFSFELAVDEIDAFGCTPLWHAAFANELGHVTYLLSRGADPNSRSTATSSLTLMPAGTSVYEAGRKRGDLKLLATLRDAGARTAQQEAAEAEAESGGADPFAVGARVAHAKFGEGEILMSEGDADERKLTVHFADGTRVLLAKFLSPAS